MLEQLKEVAVESALKAGDLLRRGFGTNYSISSKDGKNNLVTEYDNKSEELIIQTIKSKFPDHSFLAEESGFSGINDSNKIRWIIDPLDGTVNFAHSLPIFCISIAAELNNDLLCAVIYQPMTNELFVATKNHGATLNNNPIHVSNTANLDTSFLVTGFPYNVNTNPCNCIDNFVSIIQKGIPVRRLGSAAMDLAYTAAGIFDGFWEINLHPWDVAAGILLVQEAGGKVTQYDNNKYSIGANSLIASNGVLHNQIVDVLSKCTCGIKYNH